MEIVEQIKQVCLETDNEWFLTHDFTKIALYDLKLKEEFEKENVFNFDDRLCVCLQDQDCISCDIELDRIYYFDNELNLSNATTPIYDHVKHSYYKSKWIIPEKIDDEIPGFMLIKCTGDGLGTDEGFTHKLEFALVRDKYRKTGILKNMVNSIPKEWNIWLEASDHETENVQDIWEKCGFSYHKNIYGHIIYKKSTF